MGVESCLPGRRIRVSRLAVLAIGTFLLLSAPSLLAQHGGHGGGSRGGAPRAGAADTSEAGLTDFNRALAVQATSDQMSHFQELTRNTENARKLAQDLSGLDAKADSGTDFSRRTAALKDAVEEAQGGDQDFVKSFTKSQKAGLKELTKKLEKADSEVTKQWKDLERQLGAAKAWSEGTAGAADKLEKALEEFQSQQIELGKEMGIQTPATPPPGATALLPAPGFASL
jgi:NADH dehydrogenase/NADH:ubiquinone oxidoreductase subunit G